MMLASKRIHNHPAKTVFGSLSHSRKTITSPLKRCPPTDMNPWENSVRICSDWILSLVSISISIVDQADSNSLRRVASNTASVRLRTRRACRMALTWSLTVASVMPSCRAMVLLGLPSDKS